MNDQTDYSDSAVKGISRYIPTGLSKGILLLLPGAAWIAFSSIREHPDWFGLQTLSWLEKTLVAALVSALLCGVLIIVLVIDMAVALHHSKHRRVVHLSNEHPFMTFRFIVANAGVAHWLALGFICAGSFLSGYFYAGL
ncbi:hypothetical protein [Chitinimonas taiwanensis]|uniref:hypothetical protein n=1 Tax=Chitinimonas taiwanensis TaxID=240412 RepID=UPI0035B455B7